MEKDGEVIKKDEQEVTPAEQEVEVEDESGASAEPDWKELLRLERERSEKAERDRDNYKEGLLSRKRQDKRERDENGDDIDGKIAEQLKKAIAPLTEALQGNKLEQILATVVTDPSKREYVKELYGSRIQRTGTSDEAIRADIEAALDLANAKRFAKENSELKRMHDNRTYVPPNGGGSSDKGVAIKPHKWTPEQEAAIETRARSVGITDVEKYKEATWKQFQRGSAFEVQRKGDGK